MSDTSENYADQCARCIIERAAFRDEAVLLAQANHELVAHNQLMLSECERYRIALCELLNYVTAQPNIPMQHVAILNAEQALTK